MVARLDAPQPVFTFPPADEISDDFEDQPEPGLPLKKFGPFEIPALVFGAAAWSYQYNPDNVLSSLTPVRTIRLALRYGIRSFDTSAYYGPSEIVLGACLKSLEKEFPRSSYKLATKCGRYGSDHANFDYSPATIRASVQRSLTRLNTNYLDAIYLHDVEFVAEPYGPVKPGNHASALREARSAYGLAEGDEAKIRGEGDRKILDAVMELRKMQEEGLVRAVGITGYPLPTLLRIALLVLHNPPYKPLDIILSYSHLSLQNDSLKAFGPLFYESAKVQQVITASPLSMGLLTPAPPPWHPAPKDLLIANKEAGRVSASWAGGLPNLALGYAMRHSIDVEMPMAVGFSTLREVHESVRVWREVQAGLDGANRRHKEEEVTKVFDRAGFKDYSWSSP